MKRFVTIHLSWILPACLMLSASCVRNRFPEGGSSIHAPKTTGAVRLVFERSIGEGAVKTPGGLSIGPDGTLYICDREGRAVVRLSAAGEALARYAGFDSREGRLFTPIDVAAERGVDVFVLDGSSGRVIRLDRDLRGQSVIFAAGGDRSDGFAPYAGIALDHESGDILLSNRSEGVLTRLDFTGRTSRVAGGFGSVKQSLRDPAGLDAAPDGAVFVADRGVKAVACAPRFGADIRLIGAGLLQSPVDAAALGDSRVAVADARGVVVFDRSGTALGMAGFGIGPEIAPRSVAFHDGRLYVADARSRSILVYRIEVPAAC